MDKIKSKFDELKETRLEIKQGINKIKEIKDSVKKNYMQYIEKEKQNYFGLDSFHFQNKAIELEHTNMLRLYHFIDNRIYGDYYKLFHMIEKSLKEQLNEDQLHKIKELYHLKQYPVYKDLDPLKIYDFDLINQIHQDIILVLENVKELFQENRINIDDHKKHLILGMNIDNYVINQEYMNQHLHMSNQLHENYLNVFHKYHAEWLTKYYEKIELFHKQIQHHEEDYGTKRENKTEFSIKPQPEPEPEPEPEHEPEHDPEIKSVPDLQIEFAENHQPLETVLEESDTEHELDLSENTIIELKNDDDDFNL